MSDDTQNRQALAFRLLTLVALALMAAYYFSPIWWVSLSAPNYPEEAFPDGVRIHFHLDRVVNGCKPRLEAEVEEEEPLDCVHEMNVINHFIGMHPIEYFAQYEMRLAPYLMAGVAVLVMVFLFYRGPAWWVLPLSGILVPVVFLADFSYWLWYAGHNLHPWGAFTVKPFMPTVFGVGKVAQFSTHAYPHYGFGLMVLASVCLLLAMLIRRRQLQAME